MTERRIKAILDNYAYLKQYLRAIIDEYPIYIEFIAYGDTMLYVEYNTVHQGVAQQMKMHIPFDWFSLSPKALKEAIANLPRKTTEE